MLSRKHSAQALPVDAHFLALLNATDCAKDTWQNTLEQLSTVSDEVWLSRMQELDELERQYRTCQDTLFQHIKNTLETVEE